MQSPSNTDIERLRRARAAWPVEGYLVGGAVRDLLLGHAPHDFDWLVADPQAAAHTLAGHGGAVVVLDRQRGYWRVILGRVQHDFAPQPAELLSDLLRRDFTLNALALGQAGEVVDPTGGLADLRARRLRMVSADNLRADPLRLLRAARLSATRELSLDAATAQAIAAAAREPLPLPAPERVSAELERLLQSPQAARGLGLLSELHLLEMYLPELARSGLYLPGSEQVARALAAPSQARRAVLWAALFVPLLHEQTAQAVASQALARLEALRLPRAVIQEAARLLLALPIAPDMSARQARAFVQRHRALLPDVLQLDEGLQGVQAAVSREQIRHYWQAQPAAPLALLGAQEVSALLGVSGPQLGAALRALAYAQEVEQLSTPQQARNFLQAWQSRKNPTGAAEPVGKTD